MKIVDKSIDNEMLFENLKVQDVFKFDDRVFMKVSSIRNGDPDAYDFSKSRLTDISEDTIVRYVPSELILHGNGWNENDLLCS